MEPYQGSHFRIELSQDAKVTIDGVFNQVPGSKKACIAQLHARIKRFADHGELQAPGQINSEGDKFFAIKAHCGLRAYAWYDQGRRGVVVISHFILKKGQKLAAEDKKRMQANRETYKP